MTTDTARTRWRRRITLGPFPSPSLRYGVMGGLASAAPRTYEGQDMLLRETNRERPYPAGIGPRQRCADRGLRPDLPAGRRSSASMRWRATSGC